MHTTGEQALQQGAAPHGAAGQLDCFHCRQRFPAQEAIEVQVQGAQQPLCCTSCLAAVEFIHDLKLEAFYRHREKCDISGQASHQQGRLSEAALAEASENLAPDQQRLSLLLPDIRCAACIWLIEKAVGEMPGVREVNANYATRRVQVLFDPRQHDLSSLAIAHRVQQLGYEVRPDLPDAAREAFHDQRRSMLLRLGVAGIGMMQVMMFAVAGYVAGPGGMEPAYESLMRWASLALTTPVVFFSALPFHRAAWQAIRHRNLVMDVPVSIAILSAWLLSTWNTVFHGAEVYFDTACMFTFFLLIGRYIELLSRYRFQHSQDMLRRLLPLDVRRVVEIDEPQQDETVAAGHVQRGDRLRVPAGEIIPADGVVLRGSSAVSEAAFTGEPMPIRKTAGSRVLAGAVNHEAELVLRVGSSPEQFLIRQISRLYDQASRHRPRWSQLADRTARHFVGAVLLLAFGAGLFWFLQGDSNFPIITMTILVIACPCALSLATPVAYTVAVSTMRRCGIVIRNGAFLERAAETDTLVFDKTGTLTRADLSLEAIVPLDPTLDEEDCLALATTLEQHSNHPIARAFRSARAAQASAVDIVAGHGVSGEIDGRMWRIGNADFVSAGFDSAAPPVPPDASSGDLWVLLGHEHPVAWFRLRDRIRTGARETLLRLRELGYRTLVLTGDRSLDATQIRQRFGCDDARTGMTPADKIEAIRCLTASGRRVMMIGDGINDAGAMAAADTSLAVSPRDIVVQHSADASVLGNALPKLPQLLAFARRSRRIIRQNISWSVTYNFTVIPFALAGMVAPWMAALGMSLSSLLVIGNAGRLARMGGQQQEHTQAQLSPATPAEVL